MVYVGIRNCKEKTKMLLSSKKKGRIIDISLPGLCSNGCERHIEVLELFKKGIVDPVSMRRTALYKYQKDNGRTDKVIQKRIQLFYKTFKSISAYGYLYELGYIVVTEDGARLDGSHRSAIVESLGFKSLKVISVKWSDTLTKSETKRMTMHLSEQKRKILT